MRYLRILFVALLVMTVSGPAVPRVRGGGCGGRPPGVVNSGGLKGGLNHNTLHFGKPVSTNTNFGISNKGTVQESDRYRHKFRESLDFMPDFIQQVNEEIQEREKRKFMELQKRMNSNMKQSVIFPNMPYQQRSWENR